MLELRQASCRGTIRQEKLGHCHPAYQGWTDLHKKARQIQLTGLIESMGKIVKPCRVKSILCRPVARQLCGLLVLFPLRNSLLLQSIRNVFLKAGAFKKAEVVHLSLVFFAPVRASIG